MEREQTKSGVVTTSLTSLLLSFLKIGSIGFGGGMAIIALMEKELVRDRRLLTPDDFVHGVGLGQGLGAFPVNVAIFTGYQLFGMTGALLSAGAFLLPSVALIILLADLYFRYHSIPSLQSTMAGLAPVVVALILSAAFSIGKKVVRSWQAVAIATTALIASVYQVNAAWVLLASGTAGHLLLPDVSAPTAIATARPKESPTVPAMLLALNLAPPFWAVLTTFLKIGFVFFGGGFVLVPILRHRLVSELEWLKPQEFLDALAISNLAPGPIALIATFAGYHHAGAMGALIATVALFAPGVILMLIISWQYRRLRNDRRVQRFLAGINPAVVGLILSAVPALGQGAFTTWPSYLLFALSLALLTGLRWHPAFVLAIGSAAGYFRLLP